MGAVVDGVDQPAELVERMFNGNCEVVAYDQSFYNLGMRPFEEDFGLGEPDPFGNPGALIAILTTLPARDSKCRAVDPADAQHRQSPHRHRRAHIERSPSRRRYCVTSN